MMNLQKLRSGTNALRIDNEMRQYMAKNTETLGAHLRNLLTPYKTLLCLIEDEKDIKLGKETLEKYGLDNLDELISFSNSEMMENTLWRKEDE